MILSAMALTRLFPEYSVFFSVIGAVLLLPIFSIYLILAIVPLIDHLRGVRQMPFEARPVDMSIYSVLRVLIFIAGLYLFLIYVLPVWRGAFNIYVEGGKPDAYTAQLDQQGSGLSFVPLVGGITMLGQPDEFTWFYGHYLSGGDAQSYTFTVIPGSKVIMNVTPINNVK